ncbi:hypothetical protein [Aeoliella mucimassa]|nr:hypothetical protein [Aeoliella mucimassa]
MSIEQAGQSIPEDTRSQGNSVGENASIRIVEVLAEDATQDSAKRTDSYQLLSIDTSSTAPETNSLEQSRERLMCTAYRLCELNEPRMAVMLVMDHLDDYLHSGDFVACNSVLRCFDPSRLADAVIITVLGITLGAKQKLTSRNSFYQRALEVFGSRRGEDEAKALLSKYQ